MAHPKRCNYLSLYMPQKISLKKKKIQALRIQIAEQMS